MSDDVWDDQPNEDEFAMDGEGMGDDLGGGGGVDREGWYHFEVTDVFPELNTVSDSGNDKTAAVRFDLSVLAAVDGQSPIGAKHFHRIYVGSDKDGAKKSAYRFGVGLGLLRTVDGSDDGSPKSVVDAATGKRRITIATWRRAKGMQCVAKIGMSKKTEKYDPKPEIPYGRVYRPDEPSVKDVTIDKDMWALAANHSSQQPPPADIPKTIMTPNSQIMGGELLEDDANSVDECADL